MSRVTHPKRNKNNFKVKIELRCSGLTVKTKLFTYRRFKEGRCPTKILCHLNTHLHLINYLLNLSFFILPRILVCSLQIVQCPVTHSQLNFVCSGIAYEEMSNYSLDKVIMYNN